MAQAVSRRHLNVEARVRSQASPCDICCAWRGYGTGFKAGQSAASSIQEWPKKHNFSADGLRGVVTVATLLYRAFSVGRT